MPYQTIITVDDLAQQLDSPDWLILDCRGQFLGDTKSYKTFTESHIPNAFYCCFNESYYSEFGTDEASPYGSNVEPKQILDRLKDVGYEQYSQVIIYDNDTSLFTDALWLKLRAVGCQNVAVLQGGYKAWLQNQLPVKICPSMQDKQLHADE